MTTQHDERAELVRLTYAERRAFIQDAVIRGSYDSLVSAVEKELVRKAAALLADGRAWDLSRANEVFQDDFTAGIAFQKDAAAPLAETESVLIDGKAYTVQAEVAAELLRLHLALLAAPAAAQVAQPLTVWFDQMPESNGKRNWTVMLRRKDSEGLLGSIASGVCFERTEYYDQARYAADRLRFLIGELAKEPDILDYDPDILQPEEAHGIGKDQPTLTQEQVDGMDDTAGLKRRVP